MPSRCCVMPICCCVVPICFFTQQPPGPGVCLHCLSSHSKQANLEAKLPGSMEKGLACLKSKAGFGGHLEILWRPCNVVKHRNMLWQALADLGRSGTLNESPEGLVNLLVSTHDTLSRCHIPIIYVISF